jgi:hypothetical protein
MYHLRIFSTHFNFARLLFNTAQSVQYAFQTNKCVIMIIFIKVSFRVFFCNVLSLYFIHICRATKKQYWNKTPKASMHHFQSYVKYKKVQSLLGLYMVRVFFTKFKSAFFPRKASNVYQLQVLQPFDICV